MAGWIMAPEVFLSQTLGSGTWVYRVLFRLPASAVQEFKCVAKLKDKSANYQGQLAWRVYDADEDVPGSWNRVGTVFNTSNTPTNSGLVDLSGSATLDAAAWIEFGFAFSNSAGAAIETAQVWVQVQGRD